MKKHYSFLLIFHVFFLMSNENFYENSAITFQLNGGRFGDCIFNYTKSKLLAYKYQIPFYLRNFAGCNLLNAGLLEKKFNQQIGKNFKHVVRVNAEKNMRGIEKPVLFITSFKTQIEFPTTSVGLFQEIIENKEFGNEIKRMLQPAVPVKILPLPEDRFTVAVHIRKGTPGDGKLISNQMYQGHENLVSYDEFDIKRVIRSDHGRFGLKFPPEQFYIDQIKMVSQMIDNQPMYVFLFTDQPNAKYLVDRFKNSINLPNIIFDSHAKHSYKSTFIEDYYNMSRFDCLIRPNSAFSIAAQYLGNHSLVIYPEHGIWQGKNLIMDKITILRISDTTVTKTTK